jgi:hypothetical protein
VSRPREDNLEDSSSVSEDMTGRHTRLIPYAQLALLAALLLAVIVTAPFSSPRRASAQARPGRPSPASQPRLPDDVGTPSVVGGLRSLPASPPPGPDPNEIVAERSAAQLLDEVAVPAGSVRVSLAPAGTPDLGSPPQETGVKELVDDHRLWIVPGSPQAVLSWFGTRPIPGSLLVGHGSEGRYSTQQLSFEIFWLAPLGQVLPYRELMIGVAQDPAGNVVLRVDTQIVWAPTRPAGTFVPDTAARVVVTDTPEPDISDTIGSPRSRRSSDPAVVHHFVSVVNAMPEATDGVIDCPAFSGDRYTLAFESGTGVTLGTVTLNDDECFGISIDVPGVASISLSDPGEDLLHALNAFLPPSEGSR